MALELEPDQPHEVAVTIERLLAGPAMEVDPWWSAGLDEALRGGDRPAAEDTRGRARVVEA